LDTYYAWQAGVRVPSPPATSSTVLLDQLPDTGIAVRGRPLTDLLQPAYRAVGRGGQAERAWMPRGTSVTLLLDGSAARLLVIEHTFAYCGRCSTARRWSGNLSESAFNVAAN
jgi:hypothetical protein